MQLQLVINSKFFNFYSCSGNCENLIVYCFAFHHVFKQFVVLLIFRLSQLRRRSHGKTKNYEGSERSALCCFQQECCS